MTKKDIQEALEIVRGSMKELKDWMVRNHSNPYSKEVTARLREYKNEEERLEKLDAETYPSQEEVKAYKGKELLLVFRTLPKPRNEDERLIFYNISDRIKEYLKPI